MTSPRALFVAALAASLVGISLAGPAAAAAGCKLQPQADGNVYPVVCKDGKANPRAEAKLTKLAPNVMALGKGATARQVRAAVCEDLETNPIMESVLLYQTTKYGWPKRYANAFNDSVGTGGTAYC